MDRIDTQTRDRTRELLEMTPYFWLRVWLDLAIIMTRPIKPRPQLKVVKIDEAIDHD